MKKLFLVLLTVCMLFSVLGCSGQQLTAREHTAAGTAAGGQQLTVKVLDIGQGDAVLIQTPQETILFDTGDVDERDNLVRLLKKEKVEVIDKLIISHPHADHLGGAYAVLQNFTVKAVYDNGQPTTTKTYQTYLKQIKQKKIAYQNLKAGDTLELDSTIRLDIFNPTPTDIKKGGELNSNSLVGKLVYGKFTMLLTGDCEADREKVLVQKYADKLQADVLKAPHHGSKTSSNRGFLQTVAPEAVIISCGVNNDYGHPHKEAMNRYKGMKLDIYRTDQDGTVTVTTDGSTYQIAKEK